MLAACVFASIMILYVLYRAWFKITHPFWSRQPVFHFHSITGWFLSGRVLNDSAPSPKNRYYDKSLTVTRVDDELCESIAAVLSANYSENNLFRYTPSGKELSALLCDDGMTVFARGSDQSKVGCITSYKAKCRLHDKSFELKYVDNMCIAKKHRGTGLAEKLIYTLAVESVANSTHPVLAFKREGGVTPIVPLVIARSISLMAPLNVVTTVTAHLLPTDIALSVIDVCLQRERYTCVLSHTPSTLVGLLDKGFLRVFGCECGDIFVFRELSVTSEKPVIQCVGAFKAPSTNTTQFREAFAAAVRQMSPQEHILIVDSIGDAAGIQGWCETISNPLEVSSCSYYFYNYIEHPHRCDEVVILI